MKDNSTLPGRRELFFTNFSANTATFVSLGTAQTRQFRLLLLRSTIDGRGGACDRDLWDYLRPESVKAGLKPLGWHALRHSYRTRLAEKKTGPEVHRDLMRHSTIARSLDGYGLGVPDLNREANYAVVNDLLSETRLTDCKVSK